MGLSYDIISEFVKVTNGNKEKPKEGIVYATIVQASDGKYVKIDGSDLLTPTDTTTDIEDGERVTVMIKDHRATVTGNVTAPSASGNRVDKVVETVTEQIGVFETVVADKVSVNELEAYKATIENLIVGKADIEDLEATNAVIENLKVKDAEIENAIIDKADIEDLEAVNAVIENLKVKDAEIENLVADKATINDLNAVNADIQNLKAQHAHIEDLVADKADIEDLEATNAEIENLKVKDAEIENLVADKATIEDLEATKAEIEVLDADFAEIKTLVSGNLTSDNILSFNITADKVTMEDAFIKDAMIDTVNAAKINAGRINTNSVVIGSEDGGMRISGATQQFTDKNGNVRIQIGRDASNDFTFALYGEDGQGQIINQNGITASAIADGLIVNDMVSDNAAISGGKLDISSVVTEINNDNTTTINSNKIYLDEQNQSLEVAFKSLKTQVDTIKDIDSDLTTITDKIQSNTSKIEANKSSISTLLAEDAAIKKQVTDLEGNVVETTNTLTSKYTSLQQNLDGFKTTVNNTYATKTSVNDVKNNLSSNYSTTSAMNSAINQKVDEISASISSTYATKNEVKSIDDNIRTNYSTTNQMSSAISVAKDEINLGISQVYETKAEVTNKVTNAVSAIRVGGTNLITKKSGYTYGYLDRANGNPNNSSSLNDNQDFYTNNYFPIKNGETVYFTAYPKDGITSTLQSGVYIHVYNTSKQWVKQVNNVTSAKAKSQVSYKATSDGFIRFSGRGFNDYNHMAEYTTIPTTWSPAPEDIDSAITNAGTSAVETSKSYTDSQIKLSKDSIELGISQTYETKTSVSSQVSTALTSAKSYADTKKSEAISTASSDATTKANNALSSAKSYADTKKSEAITSANNTLNTTIANYYTKTQTDSQIKATKDAIDLSVKNTYETKEEVTNKIQNLIVGGVNRALGTGVEATWNVTSGENRIWSPYYIANDVSDKKVIIAFDYEATNIIKDVESKTRFQSYYRNTSDGDMFMPSYEFTLPEGNSKGTIVSSVLSFTTIKTDYKPSFRFRFDNVSGTFKISKARVIIGSKDTGWSLAPEDVEETISTTLTESKAYADSQIKIAKDAINLGVSQTYETKTNVTSKVNSAISTASSDATTKANNALSSAKTYADTKKTEAINSANSTLNTTIANYYTKAQTDSQIKVAKDAITSSVSSTYETKTNVQNKIDAITIGGRNLAQGTSSSYSNPYSSFTGVTNTCPGLGKVLTDGLNVGDKVTIRLIYKYTDIVAASGQTAQCWIQGSGNTTSWSSGAFPGSTRKTISGSGQHEFLYTFTITEDHLKNSHWNTNVRHDYVQSGSVQWKMFKVEKGTKPTDWSPAPEDVETSISNIETRVSTAEQKITSDAIVSTVTSSKTYTDAMTGKVSKTEVISSINQTAEAIKINANKIALTGDVVVSAINGGSTTINGSKITTGTISANSITSGTFQGTNFIAGGSSNGNGYFQVKDSSNSVKFHASKDGVYATKIQFPDSISISGSIIQSGNVSASSSGFATSGSESGSLYRTEYQSNLGLLGLTISSQYYNTEGGGNVAGTKKTIKISGDAIGFTAGSSYAQLSQSGTNIYSQGGYDSYNGYYCDGTMSLKKASHGGIDVGNTSAGVAICSKTSPTWWNGSKSYTVYTSGSKPTPADIGAAKALVSANGYQGMTLNDGSTSNWIRTTTNGLLPSASSGSSWPSSSSSLGTSSWRFSKGYVKEMYVNGLTNDLGDIWLTAKTGANTIYAQAKWLCPATSVTTYLGSSGYRWHSVWAANGTIQTSDERFKVKQGFTNIDDCFEMIKNTDIYNYIMLNKSKEKLSKNRLGKMAMENSKNDVNIHIGIMAQDIQKYECSKGILIESEYEKEDGTTDTLLGINAYGLATAVMGGLKKEIQIRNEQYECLKRENEELKTRLANIERMLTRTLD